MNASTRRRKPHRARLDETLRALDLVTESEDIILPAIAARAFDLALPADLTEREERLLELAQDVTQSPRAAAAFQHATRSYLALAAGSWAENEAYSVPARDAALVGAVAVAAPCNPNVRRAMGVDAKLRSLSRDPALDERSRAQAARLAAEEPVRELELYRSLRPVLDAAEARERHRTSSRRVGGRS